MYDLLSGLRVIEGSAFVAAPLGGMTLAQLGAEVIRFDPVGGGMDHKRWPLDEKGNSLYWAGLNKGKKSIAVNSRKEEGRELITAIICQSGQDNGIFLTNHPPGGPFSYEKLKAEREDLIMLNILGSHDGTPAVDYTINSALGFPFATGPRDSDRPVNHLLPAWDLVTGSMAATGILAAERQRTRNGHGNLVKLALSDVGIWVASALGHVAEATLLGQNRNADGNHIYGAFGHDFLTLDGKRIMLTALTKAQWNRLKVAVEIVEAVGKLELKKNLDLNDEGDRYKARDDIVELIKPWVASRNFNILKNILDVAGVLWGPYQKFTELVNNDSRCSSQNPLIELVEQENIGTYPIAGLPLRFEDIANIPVKPAPLLGANTDEVLSEVLGIPEHSIADLHDRGIIGGVVNVL
jgi:2-methylfumaryl-CoA isomerase